jgi:phosphoribosylformimino-5-aminoimidazole carboxamide ribotide isomerase
MLQSAAIEFYREIHAEFPEINLVASDGVRSINDFKDLAPAGCAGAIVGKAIYENKITLAEIENYLKNAERIIQYYGEQKIPY